MVATDGNWSRMALRSKRPKQAKTVAVGCDLAVKIRDDVAQALDLPSDKVRVTLKQKARGGITITATS